MQLVVFTVLAACGMIVSYETFPKGVDATPLFKGLPDDMCQSPHWGYILKGRVRYPASAEIRSIGFWLMLERTRHLALLRRNCFI